VRAFLIIPLARDLWTLQIFSRIDYALSKGRGAAQRGTARRDELISEPEAREIMVLVSLANFATFRDIFKRF